MTLAVMASKLRKHWFLILLGVIIVSFLFNRGFRSTLARHQEMKKLQDEYQALTQKTADLKDKIYRLENHPPSYETLVRKELGYVKPGEKEVRFITPPQTP